MKALGWMSSTWVLAIILGLMGVSCTTPKRAGLIKKNGDLPHGQQVVGTTATGSDATKAKVQAAYSKLPLSFEANQGQTDEQVKFLSRGDGYTLFLTPSEAVLTLRKSAPPTGPAQKGRRVHDCQCCSSGL